MTLGIDELTPSLDGPCTTAWHKLEVFEKALETTKTQIYYFESRNSLSAGNALRSAWALLLHIYRGVQAVEFCEVDGSFQTIDKLYLQIDEQMSLLDLCKAVKSSARYENANACPSNTAFFLNGGNAASDGYERKPNGIISPAFELVASLHIDGDRLQLSVFYNKLSIEKSALIRYCHTFEKILQCLTQHSDQPLRQVSFLSDYDRNQLIAWNTPIPEMPVGLTICSLFADHVRSRPQAPALYAWDGAMTYGELDYYASRFAVELVAFGVLPESIVPFCMEKSKWALVGALAILKTGAALVPVDPAWPRQRVTVILGATEATIAICSNATRSCFDEMPVRPFEISNAWVEAEIEERQELQHVLPEPSTRQVAFILFSSGSTGVPKGMVREHGTACIGSIAHAEALHMNSDSRVLQFANHVFDVAMLDFFTTLIVGGCVCIPSESDRRNDLAGFIQRSHANWVLLTPTVAGILDPSTVPSLRDVTLGGEAISAEILDRWLPHCRVSINYGSAEVDVTQARDVDDSHDTSNVGKRLGSCVTYIVDPENMSKVLPIGAVGELLISGPTMARSYLKNPEKTAASFVAAPVDWYQLDVNGNKREWMNRAYRMGDLLQQQWDGSFKFIGRLDFQVKVHGQKVELGEIEAQLATHPAVRLCAVLYPRSGPLAERLVAVIQLFCSHAGTQRRGETSMKKPSRLGLEDIKRYLSDRVPSYMLPQACILADPMPLTATMKIDRTKVKTWLVEDDPVLASCHVLTYISTALKASKLSSEQTIALKLSTMIADLVATEKSPIWSSIQGHNNSLADIGVDSVQIMRLSSMIWKTFGRKVPVETLTDKRLTIESLAEIIETQSIRYSKTSREKMTGESLRRKLEKALLDIRVGLRPTRTSESNGSMIECANQPVRLRNIFLTGVTGYLGIQILRVSLQFEFVDNVYVLIRGADTERARARLAAAALSANWSIKPFSHRIKIWLGDLSRPQLGLQDSHWSQLTQCKSRSDQICSIIHCGAVVDWTKSYDHLEAANVTSAIQLINAALASHHVSRFLFVAGGQYFQPGSDEDRLAQLFDDAAAANGYAQTKFVAEQLVDTVRRQLMDVNDDSLEISIIKPAYLIGSEEDGMANVDDYLWRLVSAAVKSNSYNQDESSQWLLAADVGQVARTALELATSTSTSVAKKGTFKICNGIRVQDFWSIICEETGHSLRAIPGQEWMQNVKETMEGDPKHALWPLLEAFEKNAGLLTNMKLPADAMQFVDPPASIGHAIRQNVRYLLDVGYIPRIQPS